MTRDEYAKVVAKNIKRLAYEQGKTQIQMSKELNINQTTLSCWMNGTRTPKVDKLDRLCEYFHCIREDIMEPYNPSKENGKISDFELKLIEAYRSVPDSRKESVRVLLNMKEGG